MNCSLGTVPSVMADYNLPLHIAAIFIVLASSVAGVCVPLMISHCSCNSRCKFALVFGKHVGTGALLSLAFIHLLAPAFEALSSSCLPEPWTGYPFAALFSMVASMTMHGIDTFLRTHAVGAVDLSNGSHSHSHVMLILDTPSKSNAMISAYILEFGLTLHSVVIGMTVGVANMETLISLLVALSIHQFFEGVALGSTIVSAKFQLRVECVLAFIFGLSAPVGIAIGIGLHSSYDTSSVTAVLLSGTFDSLSAGIVLYVVFVQMIGLEFAQDLCTSSHFVQKILLFASIWIGIAVMAGLGVWL